MWKTFKLSEICEIQPPKKEIKNILEDNSEVSFLGMDLLGIDRIYANSVEVRSLSSVYKGYTYFAENDVLLAKITPCFENGKLGVARGLKNGVGFGSSEFVVFRCNKKVLPEFLYYFLNQTSFRAEGKKNMSGAVGHKRETKEFIVNSLISLPPLAEQQRIVTKLDAAFAQIDELKTCALTQATQVQLLIERVLSEQTTADDELVQLSDVCGIASGLVDPKIFPYKEQIHVGAGNIVSSSNELIELKTAEQEKLTSGKYPFDEATVLYSKIRPYLKKVHLPNFNGICSADIYPLKPNSEKLDREYLFYVLLSENFTNYAIAGSARAGMPKVNRNHLFAYSFRLPPLDKQKHIIKVLNTAFASKNELEEIIQRKIAAIDSLKSAVLTQELQSEAA